MKLATVLHPLLGVSGRAIVAALVAGETDPDRLVALAHPQLRAKRAALRAALPGHVRPHLRILLRQHLRVVETLRATIAELDALVVDVQTKRLALEQRRLGADLVRPGGAAGVRLRPRVAGRVPGVAWARRTAAGRDI